MVYSEAMKILMCTGGSKYAKDAIKFGAQIAKGLATEVIVLSVKEPGQDIKIAEDALVYAMEVLENFSIKAKTKIREGEPAHEILDETELGYDLLIIGYLGTKGIARFLLGDTAIRVVEYSKIPTLIVKGDRKLSKILLCISASKYSEEVVEFVGKIARATGSKVMVLYVKPFPTMFDSQLEDRQSELLFELFPVETEYLKKAAETLINMGIKDVNIKMRKGFCEEKILEEAAEEDADLIAVGSHGWWGLSSLLVGALSFTIAKHAKTSVLIVKPKEMQIAK